jgi:hypothetical protein
MQITIGSGLPVLLAVLFIALKLCGVIAWSWVWVLSPLWIGLAIGLVILIIFAVIFIVGAFLITGRK